MGSRIVLKPHDSICLKAIGSGGIHPRHPAGWLEEFGVPLPCCMPEIAMEIRRTGWFASVTIFVPSVCSQPLIQWTGFPRGGGVGEGITVGMGEGDVGAGIGEGFDAAVGVEWCEQAPTTIAPRRIEPMSEAWGRMARPSLRGRARQGGLPVR